MGFIPAAGGGTNGFAISLLSGRTRFADGGTTYLGLTTDETVETADESRVYVPKAATLKAIYLFGVNGVSVTAESITAYVRKNNTDDTEIGSGSFSGSKIAISSSEMDVSFDAGDYFEVKFSIPSMVTNPTDLRLNGVAYFEV